jgi:MFS family permease
MRLTRSSLSQWYTRRELAKRTVIFFFGVSLSTAFGSLIAAGCIKAAPKTVLRGWELIFIVDGAGTIAAGILALMLLPKSPRHTAGIFRGKGWFSEREADVFIARIERDDPLKVHRAHVHIGFKDIFGVLSDWLVALRCHFAV